MPGRLFPSESLFEYGHYSGPSFRRRRAVLRETIDALRDTRDRDRLHSLGRANLDRWRARRGDRAVDHDSLPIPPGTTLIGGLGLVFSGDWGAVTQQLTRAYGDIFAVLNMANSEVPGGGYIEGCPAQEENLFRRSDCHFSIPDADFFEGRPESDRYRPELTRLLSGQTGRVYLDAEHPRICLRGPEDPESPDLGYAWLADDQVFPFLELRAAAQDLRRGRRFSEREALGRIEAQLDTLIEAGVQHAVLSAFGCGAFQNPSHEVARLYREALLARRDQFECVAFAIYYPGYGPDNEVVFRKVFEEGPSLLGHPASVQ